MWMHTYHHDVGVNQAVVELEIAYVLFAKGVHWDCQLQSFISIPSICFFIDIN